MEHLRSKLLDLIRRSGLAPIFDYFRFWIMRLVNYRKNTKFKEEHSSVVLPPAYILYESFQMNYHKYYIGGKETAKWLVAKAEPFVALTDVNILDWGCGPARIIRHLPTMLGSSNDYFGCDYSRDTIKWCKKAIPGVRFTHNDIDPPLPYENEIFDLIYGISILTHLSEENHFRWLRELNRILKRSGIAILTTHGEAFTGKLTKAERDKFDSGRLVVRNKAKEGQRTYGAFHPVTYVKSLSENAGYEIKKHVSGVVHDDFIEQDVWILSKE